MRSRTQRRKAWRKANAGYKMPKHPRITDIMRHSPEEIAAVRARKNKTPWAPLTGGADKTVHWITQVGDSRWLAQRFAREASA